MQQKTLLPRALAVALAGAIASSCVTQSHKLESTLPAAAQIFELPPPGTPPAGNYHGVGFFFEVDEKDMPEVAEWMKEEDFRTLPPIIPESFADGREVYRVRDLHKVEYHHSMFLVGESAYSRMPNARLYVFKRRPGSFSFAFRGQGIVVPSDVSWIPSIYYYSTVLRDANERLLKKETVQVGFATIETVPEDGSWLVNGRKYYPDKKRPLELLGAIHAEVAR